MRIALALLAGGLLAASAQEGEDSLKARFEEKLKEPFLKKAPWLLDFAKAREESAKTGRPIFALFTRSYEP